MTMLRTVFRTCTLCEAMCGLRLDLDGDRIVSVRGDEDDPFSQGYICPKGVAIGDVHHDPDRLRTPLRRAADGSFAPIGWYEAFDLVERRLQAVRARGGADAIAVAAAMPPRSSDCTDLIELDRALKALFSWLTLTASVPAVPAATLVICRRSLAVPTDTVLARFAIDPLPNATEFGALAMLLKC